MFEFEFCQANKSSSSLSSSDSGELSRVNLLMRLRLSCSSLMWLSLGVSKMSKSCEDLLSSLSAGRSFTPCLIILRMLSMGFTEKERKYQYMSNVKLCKSSILQPWQPLVYNFYHNVLFVSLHSSVDKASNYYLHVHVFHRAQLYTMIVSNWSK